MSDYLFIPASPLLITSIYLYFTLYVPPITCLSFEKNDFFHATPVGLSVFLPCLSASSTFVSCNSKSLVNIPAVPFSRSRQLLCVHVMDKQMNTRLDYRTRIYFHKLCDKKL